MAIFMLESGSGQMCWNETPQRVALKRVGPQVVCHGQEGGIMKNMEQHKRCSTVSHKTVQQGLGTGRAENTKCTKLVPSQKLYKQLKITERWMLSYVL